MKYLSSLIASSNNFSLHFSSHLFDFIMPEVCVKSDILWNTLSCQINMIYEFEFVEG